jgi:adenine deaminase
MKATPPGLRASLGEEPADLVVENCTLFNPFTCEWEHASFAVAGGIVVGIGEYRGRSTIDFRGARVIPGLIDAHVHIESSLLTPSEYGRMVLSRGTTTVIADPHEIANVAGIAGLDYMLNEREETPLDIFYMLPSCVPATPMDVGGAQLTAEGLRPFLRRDGVLGLGEMMNVPGVLAGAEEVWAKIGLCDLIDGHAPLLAGNPLNAYVYAGMSSDHECTIAAEALAKLRRGMAILIREGSTEKNIAALASIVSPCTVSRCCFATDDRHADMLAEGHIDDCIRKAVAMGVEPELALRMATLSPAEHYRLRDRGAIAPGRIADFCVLCDGEDIRVERTFKRGVEVRPSPPRTRPCLRRKFACAPISIADLAIEGSGEARIIGLVEHQILTNEVIREVDSRRLPDTDLDILKAVVCDRYRHRGCGIGLVQGFGLKEGAIAGSVSHDAHNIVAVGADDESILRAIDTVVAHDGALVAVSGGTTTVLPLECAGLMSTLPYEDVISRLSALEEHAGSMGCIDQPFMYLSFLSLTVIPHLRITDRGLFDVGGFEDVPLFLDDSRHNREP